MVDEMPSSHHFWQVGR